MATSEKRKTVRKSPAKRGALRLHELQPHPKSQSSRKRVGRGMGSTGKTSGRGHKGQKARSGGASPDFEGGQMPLYRRLPKRGFRSRKKSLITLPFARLVSLIADGHLNASVAINEKTLQKQGIVSSRGVKLVGGCACPYVLDMTVSGASASVREAVEKAGGSLKIEKVSVKVTHNRKVLEQKNEKKPST